MINKNNILKLFRWDRFSKFDKITEFRLKNAWIYGFGLSLFMPVLIILKGSLLPIWVISMFAIIATLSVKTNPWLCKFRLEQLYHWGIYTHIIMIGITLLYFWNPLIMIILESILFIIVEVIFSAYKILLNEKLAISYPETMKDFQIIKNDSWANASIIGLIVTTLLSLITGTEFIIYLFIVYNIIFIIWMIKNWNFFKKEKNAGK